MPSCLWQSGDSETGSTFESFVRGLMLRAVVFGV